MSSALSVPLLERLRGDPRAAPLVPAAMLLATVGVFAPKGATVLFVLSVVLLLLRGGGRAFGAIGWRRAPGILFVLAAAWMAATAIWAGEPLDALRATASVTLTALGAALLVAYAVRLSDDERTVLRRLLVVGLGAGLALLAVETLFHSPIRGLVEERPGGEGLVLTWWLNRGVTVCVLLLWPALIAASARGRGAAAALAVAAVVVVYLAPQRAGLVALAAGGLGAAAVWLLPRAAPRLIAVALAALVLAAPLLPLLGPSPAEVQAGRPGLDYSFVHRLHIWTFTAERVAERPLGGWGMHMSRTLPGGNEVIADAPGPANYLPLHPHNGALQVWVELGAVGAALVAAALLLLGRRLADPGRRRGERALLAGLWLSAAAYANLSYGLWQSWWLATLALAAALAAAAARPAPTESPR